MSPSPPGERKKERKRKQERKKRKYRKEKKAKRRETRTFQIRQSSLVPQLPAGGDCSFLLLQAPGGAARGNIPHRSPAHSSTPTFPLAPLSPPGAGRGGVYLPRPPSPHPRCSNPLLRGARTRSGPASRPWRPRPSPDGGR